MLAAIPTLTLPRNTGAVQVVHVPNPDDVELPPRPRVSDCVLCYQHVLLHVPSGKLSFFCRDWRQKIACPKEGEDQSAWDAQHPGSMPNITWNATAPVPELLSFAIDTWTPVDWPADEKSRTPAWVYMTREEGERFVASLVSVAQQLVDNLFRVPGTEDLEWSAESAAACAAISGACSRYRQRLHSAVVVSLPGTVNMADAVAAVPEVVKGNWAELEDGRLDDQADAVSGWAGQWHPELMEKFGVPYRDNSGMELRVYGARSWLRAYRAHEANGRLVIGAAPWFDQPEHALDGRVHASDDDLGLAAFAKREQAVASREGVKLVNMIPVVRSYRDRLRSKIFEVDLPRACAEMRRLMRAKAALAGLVGDIVSWGDPRFHSDDDEALAKVCDLPTEVVKQLRTALTEYATEEAG